MDNMEYVSPYLVETVKAFPVSRTVIHCDLKFEVSPLAIYTTCLKCKTEIKLSASSSAMELEDLFDAFLTWSIQPGASEVVQLEGAREPRGDAGRGRGELRPGRDLGMASAGPRFLSPTRSADDALDLTTPDPAVMERRREQDPVGARVESFLKLRDGFDLALDAEAVRCARVGDCDCGLD